MNKKFLFIGSISLSLILVLLLVTMVFAPAKAQEEGDYLISVEPVGHWHVLDSKTLIFNVHDLSTSEGVEGLDLVAEIARASSDSVSTRSVTEEQIIDQGDGLYSLEYTPASLDAYALVVHFEQEGQRFYSRPIAFETSRAGEEGIQVEANGTTYVYQIRYNWNPGHIHANDEEPVTLTFELMRGIPTGDEINWEQPWTNGFDHVTATAEAVLLISTEDGSILEELPLVYKGRGIYEAERVFTVEEVGDGRDFTVQSRFTDDLNGAIIELSEPAVLHAVAPH